MNKKYSRETIIKQSISLLLFIIAILSILEWIFKIQFLPRIYPLSLPTSPDTAFIITLFSIFLFFEKLRISKNFRIVLALAALYGLLSVTEFLVDVNLTAGFLFASNEKIEGYPVLEMSPVSGLLIFLAGITLIFSNYLIKTNRHKVLIYPGFFIFFSGFIIMTGYLYKTPFLYESEIIPVSFTSSILFLLLGYGIWLIPGNEFFRRDAIVGKAASGLIKAIIPVVAGSIFLEGLMMERFTHSLHIHHALFVSVVALTLIIFISIYIFQVSKAIFKTAIQFETELKKEHHFNQLLLDNMVEGVIGCDKDGNITLTNKVICDWLGYDLAGEKVGHPYTNLELFDSSGHTKLNPNQTPLFRAFHGEHLHNMEFLIKGKQVKYVHVSGAPLYDDQNKRYGAVITMHDLTESKERQKERTVTMNLLKLLNKSNNLHELTGSVTMFVKELVKCDTVGIRFRDTTLQFTDTQDEDHAPIRNRCNAEGYQSVAVIPLRIENDVLGLIQLNDKRKDFFPRSLITFLEQLSPYIAIALLQRKTKADLTESEEKYRSLAETTDDYIMRYDEHCRHIYVNPAVLKITGMTSQQLLGKTHAEAGFDEATSRFFEEKIREVFITGEPCQSQFSWESIQGPVYLDWKLKPEFDSCGKISSVLGVSRDITMLKKIEEELIRAKEKAEQNDKLKSAFLANMSHEVRNPINVILGFSELLMKSDVSDTSFKQFAEIIHNRSNYLLGLIEDILDLSKVEAGILNIRDESFKLNLLFDEIAAQTKMKLQKMDRDLELKFIKGRADGDSIIHTDQKRLQQILINLIDNAIKFTKEGSITVRYYTQTGKGIVFSVADTGIGIPEDKKQIIFERFHRSADPIMNSSGLGLGLSICRGLIKLLGGKIWVESEINKGSVFSFNIPGNFMEYVLTRE